MTIAQAASLLGCSASHFYRLRASIAERGEIDGIRQRQTARPRRDAAIIACALEFPDEGPEKIANRLKRPERGGIPVAHGTVSTVLRRAGLGYVRDRRRAAESRRDGAASHP